MSGGFFRGTSADQDTRFSNKHAKLLKSQKFASELNHLVDMTKVKMDVMRPWIANRVTELLGFEDEVLINFIYGLLDVKVVNGKEVQITLTGFMEKNTGKFMKELWTHLLSAQNNASGVPQQFLDAKEEETRKKMAETNRIANEIQKKKEKEGRELEQEKLRKMDVKVDISRANNADLEPSSKHQLRASSAHPMDEKETSERNGSRARSRVSRSPLSVDRSSLSPRDTRSRSVSKSFSNSRSYSDERRKSRSISESPQPRQSHRKYSPRQSLSPSRHRLSHSRRRSTSRSRRRSPSPVRHRLRSPLRRRLRSPMRHIPRSPVRRSSRSLLRYRSRSPIRRRSPSPVRQRSPSPVWRRSPSPLQRRSLSPPRRRSPFLVRQRYRRSPSTPRRRSPSPVQRRSPIPSRRRSPTNCRHRYPSPEALSSLSPVRHLSPSPGRRKSPKCQRRSPVQCQRERIRTLEKFSPVRHAPHREDVEHSAGIRKGPDSVVHRPPISLRSPQRDPRDKDDTCKKAPASLPSPYRSPSHSESPPSSRRRNPSEDRRSYSPYKSPVKQTKERKIPDISASRPWKPRDQKPRHDYPETSGEEEDTNYARDNVDQKLKSAEKRSAYSSKADDHKDSLEILHCMDDYSPERAGGAQSSKIQSRPDGLELRKKDQEIRSEKTSRRVLHPEVSDQQQLTTVHKVSLLSESQQVSYPEEAYKTDEKNRSRSNEVKAGKRRHEAETALKSTRKVDENDRSGSLSSGSQENDRHHPGVHEKRKHKRSGRQEVASDDSYNSEVEERKEAKRRRKGEKRLRKEERRRRREERCRRREQRRAEKLKAKSISSVTPLSDYEKNQEDYASDDKHIVRMESGASGDEETVSEPKKLEIELRKKALESLRAKKGVGH